MLHGDENYNEADYKDGTNNVDGCKQWNICGGDDDDDDDNDGDDAIVAADS